MPRAMTILVKRGIASSFLSTLALALVGCGGGGGGVAVPTGTPIGTPNGTPTASPIPTTTAAPGTGGTPVTANEIAFVSNRLSTSDLYKVSLNGSNPIRLTARGEAIDKPSVSREGSRIVFQRGDSNALGGINNIEIAVINTDGTNFVPLTNDSTPAGRPDDYNPVFSPDGQYIYWTSTRSGTDVNGQPVDRVPHIWRMFGAIGNTGGNQVQNVSEPSAYPSVAIDGTLAYVALNRTTDPIAIRTVGGGTVYLGGNVDADLVFDVALSPDGNRVAFSVVGGAGPAATAQIRVFNVDGRNPEATIPSTNSSNGGSAWSRNSQTLYFDAANGPTSRRQIFSTQAPFTTITPLNLGAGSDNYSPAFLPGS